MGNPPYLGSAWQDADQKRDMELVLKEIGMYKNLDYIACWFYKGAKYIFKKKAHLAFVTTNSICQGEQVVLLWKPIFDKDINISFAYTSFKWSNNAKYNAGVTVAIIGISNKTDAHKKIFTGNTFVLSKNINGYLLPNNNIFVGRVAKPISFGFPEMYKGSMPRDNGHLLLNNQEKIELISLYPDLEQIIKPFIGGNEFLKDEKRFCLWITDSEIDKVVNIPEIKCRLEKVTKVRLKSDAPSTRAYADRPYLFVQRTYQERDFIFVPQVTSESREYIPIGLYDKNVVASDKAFSVYDAPLWLFGVLSSIMQMTWIKTVGGRLETRYSYSSNLCYNSFPFPKITEAKRSEIEQAAEEVLIAREMHTEKTLAQMYDPDKMPANLREAHTRLDRIVESCYRPAPFTSDEERLEHLFALYEKMTKK